MKTGRPRKNIREHQCDTCDKVFWQAQWEIDREVNTCQDCRKAIRKARPPDPKMLADRHIEILLPKTRKPRFSKARNEWVMLVKTRKSRSNEPFWRDYISLGFQQDTDMETVQAAYDAAYARLELKGYSSKTRHRKTKDKEKRKRRESWSQGVHKNLGIARVEVPVTWYTCYLPDPFHIKKRIYVGRFRTKGEARKARLAKYREICRQHLPCAVCKRLPEIRGGKIFHIADDCPNHVQFMGPIKPLYQAKLWNMVFSTGENPPGRITSEDLYYMGYFYKKALGEKPYFGRHDVEFNLDLAKQHEKPRPDEDVMFE